MFSRVRPWIGFVFRICLAGVLGYAGIAKLIEPGGARSAILAYRVFPVEWASFLGWALPSIEVLLALLLLAGLFTRWTAAIVGVLMVAFVAGIASVWSRGYSIDCGCFGGGGDVSPEGQAGRYTQEIVRDVIFAGMSLWLVIWPRTRLSLDPSDTSAPVTNEDFTQVTA